MSVPKTAMDFSVVIPHKNTPELLAKCLESIPDVSGIEILVVDDFSNRALVDEDTFPGRDDSRVTTVFSQVGKGAGGARNIALERATGRWLIFADADDYFAPAFAEALERYRFEQHDVVFFKRRSVHVTTGEESFRADTLNAWIDEARATGRLDRLRYEHAESVGKLVKRELVERHGIRFEEVPNGNDVFFSLRVGEVADSIALDDQVIYVVTSRDKHELDPAELPAYESVLDVALRKLRYLRSLGRERYGRPLATAFWVRVYRCSRRRGLARLPEVASLCGTRHTVRAVWRPVLLELLEVLRLTFPKTWSLARGLKRRVAGR